MGPWAWTRVLPILPKVDLVLLEGLDLILDPPAKLLKEGGHTQNHHLGHLLGVLVLGHALDQDLLLIPEVGLDLHPIVDPPQDMKPIFLHGKGNLHKSLGIRDFLRNVVSHLKGMPDLNRFFEGCGIPHYVWRNAQEDSRIEPAEKAEYSAIEQAKSIWWLSNNKPLYCKIEDSSPCLRDTPK